MLSLIVDGVVSLFSSGATAYKAHEETKAAKVEAKKEQVIAKLENKTEIIKAKGGLVLAKIAAKTKRFEQTEQNIQDYDMQVLKNRNNTLADEFIIVMFFLVFVMHFIPLTQPIMEKGWKSMGYSGGPAWWFEFGMVGILVSTLGLMRVLKIMFSGGRDKFTDMINRKNDGNSRTEG